MSTLTTWDSHFFLSKFFETEIRSSDIYPYLFEDCYDFSSKSIDKSKLSEFMRDFSYLYLQSFIAKKKVRDSALLSLANSISSDVFLRNSFENLDFDKGCGIVIPGLKIIFFCKSDFGNIVLNIRSFVRRDGVVYADNENLFSYVQERASMSKLCKHEDGSKILKKISKRNVEHVHFHFKHAALDGNVVFNCDDYYNRLQSIPGLELEMDSSHQLALALYNAEISSGMELLVGRFPDANVQLKVMIGSRILSDLRDGGMQKHVFEKYLAVNGANVTLEDKTHGGSGYLTLRIVADSFDDEVEVGSMANDGMSLCGHTVFNHLNDKAIWNFTQR